MSRNVRFKLSAEELDIVADFCQAIQQPLDRVAKQSLFWAINEAHSRVRRDIEAGKKVLNTEGLNNGGPTTSGDSEKHPEPSEILPSGSPALEDTGSLADPEGG